MSFSSDQIKNILEKAMNECIRPTDSGSVISDYMEKSFNDGVQMMMLQTLYQVLLIETGKEA